MEKLSVRAFICWYRESDKIYGLRFDSSDERRLYFAAAGSTNIWKSCNFNTLPAYNNRGRTLFPGRPLNSITSVNHMTSLWPSIILLSFSIPQGGVYGLLGPNGAGKTSTIRMMIGITVPIPEGQLFGKISSRATDNVGYLPEERGLYKKIKVLDHLVFLGHCTAIARRRRQAKSAGLVRAPAIDVAAEEGGRAVQGHAAENSVHRCPAA